MNNLVFLDTETTGLRPDQHEVWEVCARLRPADGSDEITRTWHLSVDLGRADPAALEISGYFRTGRARTWIQTEKFAREFSRLTWGASIVGLNPAFDVDFLGRLLRQHGACPGWDYHLVDVEALLAGFFGVLPPWRSTDLSRLVDIDPAGYNRHTAAGDVDWTTDLYDRWCVLTAEKRDEMAG